MDNEISANQRLWNEWADINARSSEYAVDQFKAGRNALHGLEQQEVGDVRGLRLLHLQCHFGLDTLTWARLGAHVTGVDFAERAIQIAAGLAAELRLPARFIWSDVYDLPAHLDETFDVVFTSIGVLSWLHDLPAWGRLVARYVKPGGFFYLLENHPFAWVLDDSDPAMPLTYPYFARGPQAFPVNGSYADPDAEVREPASYEWTHPLSEVVNALLSAGLRLEWLREYPYTVYKAFDYLEEGQDGMWRLPGGKDMLPLMFSLKATK